jgi:hypothetical protein
MFVFHCQISLYPMAIFVSSTPRIIIAHSLMLSYEPSLSLFPLDIPDVIARASDPGARPPPPQHRAGEPGAWSRSTALSTRLEARSSCRSWPPTPSSLCSSVAVCGCCMCWTPESVYGDPERPHVARRPPAHRCLVRSKGGWSRR